MSCLKRPLDGQDPDYEDTIPHETKRLRLLEENAKAEFSQRISAIIQKEFSTELANREKDVHEIQERLHQAQNTLHVLRHAIVSAFYNKRQVQSGPEEKQKRIHPAVKKLVGKEPRNWEPLHQRPSKYRPIPTTSEKEPSVSKETASTNENEKKETVSKVPRYIPPKTSAGSITPSSPRRGMRNKMKKRIVIGNISKWVPVDTREDAASHKWMMYVRGPKEAPDVSDFVSKIRFFLHPSYRPHDIAEVTSPPFHLSRRGWGEFPVRVQIHFSHSRNKPVDVIHHLKLDRTYTGLQTLGAETVVDIWLHCGSDSRILNSENEVGSTEESAPSGRSDNVEHLAPTVKIEDSVNSPASEKVCQSVAVEKLHGLTAPKVEPIDSSDYMSSYDVTSHPDAVGQGAHSSYGITSSSLDHDYFGVVNVNIKKESEDGCESVLSPPGCESVEPLPACEPVQPLPVCESMQSLQGCESVESLPVCESMQPLSGCESVEFLPGCESVQSLKGCELVHSIPAFQSVESLPGCESVQTLQSCELVQSLPAFESMESLPGCESVQSHLGSSQENMSQECIDECKVKSSVVTDRIAQNHVLEGAPVMQKHKTTNSVLLIPELLTQSKTVNNNIVEQNVPLAKNNSKLATLVKCVNKSGRVFFVTVGKANVKPQLKVASVVPKLEQSGNVPNLTSLLIKQAPTTLLQNKLSPTAAVVSKSNENTPTPKSQLNSYNCKVKGSVTSQDNFGFISSQTNSSVLIPPHGSSGNGLTAQASLLSLGANSSSFITSQGSSIVTPLPSMNLKAGVKATSPVILVNDSPEVLKQLQSSSGQMLSFLKANKSVLTADKLEVGSKGGALKDMNVSSTQNKSDPVQDRSLLIAKNGRLYLLKHPQSAVALSALAAKSNSKKFDSAPKQQDILLSDTVKGSQSLLSNQMRSAKGGISLLKKQINTVVLPTVVKPENVDKSEDARLLITSRTLVLNKANSRQITHSDRMCYLEDLNAAIELCKFDDISLALRWLLRHIPLVSPFARDPDFRVLHPYAACNEATFLQWNIGKQRAAEWIRAKTVQKALQKQFPADRVWGTRAILVWARLHGYTPVQRPADTGPENVSSEPVTQRTYSEPVGIMDWLVTNHKSDQCSGSESDAEIDVVGVEPPQTKATLKQGPPWFEEVSKIVEALDLDPELDAQCLFVREAAREVGFKFLPQEIMPGVVFCAAERILLEAIRSLADDLLRRALCMAWKRNNNRCPDRITVNDVRMAILTRPEFDLFSNRGLGVQVTDTG